MVMNSPHPEKIKPASQKEKYIGKLRSGAVLLATDTLKDPNFDSTIVLICIYGKDGAYGLVVNRISHMPLSEVFEGIKEIKNISREIFLGGPVQQTELQVIQLTNMPVEDAYKISEGIYMGGKWDDIDAMIKTDPATTKLFLGYSGWGPGQLEAEIRMGAWEVFLVDIEKLLLNAKVLVGADTKALRSFLETIKIEDK
ncbi:MAG: YqgE/AlgH family protein [Chitinispirillaceae bacterium]|nr:YqgE/AlgH family protein [Chitinispirillaceae bacterium]